MGAAFPWTFPAVFEPQTAWWIDGQPVPTVTDEVATDRRLSLTLRVSASTLESTLRSLKTDEGKVNVLPTDDGGFVAIDRANGSNTFALTPPDAREPLRQAGDFHVASYEEEMVTQTTDEWDVTLELVRDADRTDSPSLSQTPAADEWGLTTRYGTIATGRVDAEFAGTGEGGVERFELTTRLTFDQTHTFEAALSQLGGVRVREIPDGDNVAVDDTSAAAGTLTIDAPDGQSVVADGDYVVTGWESTRLNDAASEVALTIAAKN